MDWDELKSVVKDWAVANQAKREEALKAIREIRAEDLEKMGRIIRSIEILNELENALLTLSDEEIPAVFLKAFGNE